MSPMHRILPVLTAGLVLTLTGQPSAARTGPEIAAVFDSGVAAYDAGNYEQAFRIWWDLQFEDVAAMRNVAMMLRKGQGVQRDPRQAEVIFERAARAGLATAQFDLADMLLKGEAGDPDPKAALPFLRAAAKANHPMAQFHLGWIYESGANGLVPVNLEMARELYAAAAARGLKDAADRLAIIGPPSPPPPAAQPAPTQATLTPPLRPASP